MSVSNDSQAPARTLIPNFARVAAYAMFPVALAAGSIAATATPSPKNDGGTAIPKVTVTARDFAFDAVDTVQAGYTEFVLKNMGPEMHHVQLLRLDGGHTLSDLLVAAKSGGLPAWAIEAGGPNAPSPGSETHGIVKLRAGRYAIICVIPSKDGVPHVMKGMAREMIVKANGKVAAAPVADVKISLSDYTFTPSKVITAGKHIIAVTTLATAPQSHEVFVLKLARGKTVNEGLQWMAKEDGPPPFTPVGGTTGLAPGETMYLPMTLTPGEYAFVCFLPDHKDHAPHMMHGMVQQFSVK